MSERKRVTGLLVGCVVALATAMPATAQDAGDPSKIRPKKAEYSPYLNYNYPDRVFFGDTHVHTSYSTDAGMFGNTLGPDAAYRFAKGETVTSSTGVRARLLRPLDLVRSDAIRRNVSLAHQMAPGLPPVAGDRVQLQQVVLNLIVNGLDAMDDVAADRRTLTLETSIGEAGTVQIAVRDSGVGLDSEHADRIFEPFYTTKSQGMGMGLAINRSIVEAHGGRLWAAPNADQGAIFAFTVPVASEQ